MSGRARASEEGDGAGARGGIGAGSGAARAAVPHPPDVEEHEDGGEEGWVDSPGWDFQSRDRHRRGRLGPRVPHVDSTSLASAGRGRRIPARSAAIPRDPSRGAPECTPRAAETQKKTGPATRCGRRGSRSALATPRPARPPAARRPRTRTAASRPLVRTSAPHRRGRANRVGLGACLFRLPRDGSSAAGARRRGAGDLGPSRPRTGPQGSPPAAPRGASTTRPPPGARRPTGSPEMMRAQSSPVR